MKNSFPSRNYLDSKSCSKIRQYQQTKRPRTMKIGDLKQPKMDLVKSNKSSYFNCERQHQKNEGRKLIKLGTSRIIQGNKSVTRLLEAEEKGKNIMSIRTFSPSMQKISSRLSERRRERNIIRKQEYILDRLESVLQEYKRELVVCRGEKENLRKENKKLKEKLSSYCSAQKYKNHEYNML